MVVDLLEGSLFQQAEIYDEPCLGANQTSGSTCPKYIEYYSNGIPFSGQFGTGGIQDPGTTDGTGYGGFGGGGYYGGTSYTVAYAGSGGSSFISGYKGCDAVKQQIDPIEHAGDSIHYSGIVFINPTMISGNESMPLPDSTEKGIHDGTGAFRITLIQYQYHCTYKRSFYSMLIFHLSILFYS